MVKKSTSATPLENWNLFNAFLWKRLLSVLSEKELYALEYFAGTYGDDAMEKRFWTLLHTKGVNIQTFVIKAYQESRVVSNQITLKKQLISKSDVKESKKSTPSLANQKLAHKLAKFSHPVLQSFITLEIWHELIKKHFRIEEQEKWMVRLSSKDSKTEVQKLIQELEQRTQQSIQDLVTEIKHRVVSQYSEMILNTLHEVKKIHEKGTSEVLATALIQNDIGKTASILQHATH